MTHSDTLGRLRLVVLSLGALSACAPPRAKPPTAATTHQWDPAGGTLAFWRTIDGARRAEITFTPATGTITFKWGGLPILSRYLAGAVLTVGGTSCTVRSSDFSWPTGASRPWSASLSAGYAVSAPGVVSLVPPPASPDGMQELLVVSEPLRDLQCVAGVIPGPTTMRLRFVFPTSGSGDYVLTQLALDNPSPGFRSNAMAPVIADGAAIGDAGDREALLYPWALDNQWTSLSISFQTSHAAPAQVTADGKVLSYSFDARLSRGTDPDHALYEDPFLDGVANRSFEVGAFYVNSLGPANRSRPGLIVGSVSHEFWKTGVDFRGDPALGRLTRLVVLGGALTSFDLKVPVVPWMTHAARSPPVSPIVFIGYRDDDWRDEMVDYAAANRSIVPPLALPPGSWGAHAPQGWKTRGDIWGLQLVTETHDTALPSQGFFLAPDDAPASRTFCDFTKLRCERAVPPPAGPDLEPSCRISPSSVTGGGAHCWTNYGLVDTARAALSKLQHAGLHGVAQGTFVKLDSDHDRLTPREKQQMIIDAHANGQTAGTYHIPLLHAGVAFADLITVPGSGRPASCDGKRWGDVLLQVGTVLQSSFKNNHLLPFWHDSQSHTVFDTSVPCARDLIALYVAGEIFPCRDGGCDPLRPRLAFDQLAVDFLPYGTAEGHFHDPAWSGARNFAAGMTQVLNGVLAGWRLAHPPPSTEPMAAPLDWAPGRPVPVVMYSELSPEMGAYPYVHEARTAGDSHWQFDGAVATLAGNTNKWWAGNGALYRYLSADAAMADPSTPIITANAIDNAGCSGGNPYCDATNLSKAVLSAITGTLYTLNDLTLPGPVHTTRRYLTATYLLDNKIPNVARLGRTFKPVDASSLANAGNHYLAAAAYVHQPNPDTIYVALFNTLQEATGFPSGEVARVACCGPRFGLSAGASYTVTDLLIRDRPTGAGLVTAACGHNPGGPPSFHDGGTVDGAVTGYVCAIPPGQPLLFQLCRTGASCPLPD